ncbi:HlyD family efflux transporter periplasmic adaptor subunit [Lactobacillus sp. PSON]|uniref:HlyD family efflux transporter periplasmic adaptor subunit n=1 Tax=Lactobacillus sp. PSON TaxID=3455454 RepID=UPI004041DE44
MNKKYLESSEFYSARFNNFSTMIIIPVFILLVTIVLFSFIGKREIDIDGIGTIEPAEGIANVQASVNGKIIYSALKEGKMVKKNQILLRYSSKENKTKLGLYQSEKASLTEQISDLKLLRKGIQSNTNVFLYKDKFGYKNALNDYLAQRKTYLIENEQLRNESKKRKGKLSKVNKYTIEENNQKIDILQSKELQQNSQDIIKAQEQLKELKSNIANIHIQDKEYIVKASRDGVLHINNQYAENKYINPGVNVAEIYPNLSNQNSVKLITYISAADISSVKVGQEMRFKVTRNVPKDVILSGIINDISVSSMNSNKGNYYCVTALAKVTNSQKNQLKYGMDGSVSIITGKTTFFNYYKSKVFGNN